MDNQATVTLPKQERSNEPIRLYGKRKAKIIELISNEMSWIHGSDFQVLDLKNSFQKRPANTFVIVEIFKKHKNSVSRIRGELLSTFKQQEFYKGEGRKFYVEIIQIEIGKSIEDDTKVNPPSNGADIKALEYISDVTNNQISCEKLVSLHQDFNLFGVPNRDQQKNLKLGFACFNYFNEECAKNAAEMFTHYGIKAVMREDKKCNVCYTLENVTNETLPKISWALKGQTAMPKFEMIDLVSWILTKYLRIPKNRIVPGDATDTGVSAMWKVTLTQQNEKNVIEQAFQAYKIAYLFHGAGTNYLHFFIAYSKKAVSIFESNARINTPLLLEKIKNSTNNYELNDSKNPEEIIIQSRENDDKNSDGEILSVKISDLIQTIYVRKHGLNHNRVTLFEQLFRAGKKVTPIEITTGKIVIAGRNRIQGAISAGCEYIDAIIKYDVKTTADILFAALGENIDPTSSLPATEEDIVMVTINLLDEKTDKKKVVSFLQGKGYPVDYIKSLIKRAEFQIRDRQLRLAKLAIANNELNIVDAAKRFGLSLETLQIEISGEKSVNTNIKMLSNLANINKTFKASSVSLGSNLTKIINDVRDGLTTKAKALEAFKQTGEKLVKLKHDFDEKLKRLNNLK